MVSLLLIAALTTAGQSADVGDADNNPDTASAEAGEDSVADQPSAQPPASTSPANPEPEAPVAKEDDAEGAAPPSAAEAAEPDDGAPEAPEPPPETTASDTKADSEPSDSAGNAAGDGYMLFVGAGVLVVGAVVGVVCAVAAAALQWGVVMNPSAGGVWRSPSVTIVQVLVLSAVAGAGAAVMGADIVAFSVFGE